jgi:uncharacterized protein
MEMLFLFIGFMLLLTGLAGAVLPLPGPPLSFAGILVLNYSHYAHFSTHTLIVLGILTAVVTVLDYVIPAWGAKKFGGSSWGGYGSAIGLLVGMFLGPFGLFLGAFVGAFVGEYLHNKNQNWAFRAALGSFLGLLAGIVFKIALCLCMVFYAVAAVWSNFF